MGAKVKTVKHGWIVLTIGLVTAGLAAGAPAAASPTAQCADPGLVYSSGNIVPPLYASVDCQGPKKCDPWYAAGWEVEGKFGTGSGSVLFSMFCGFRDWNEDGENDPYLQCTATSQGVSCTTEVEEPTEGEISCIAAVLEGDADMIDGRCFDPVNPANFVQARIVS